ncbi:MAG TPA: hypothetical protein VHY22_00295 [Chthoniobacteraceae bacterium]|nr:hypothetical protein [Chthoniobacteraceae bacterium]
MTDEDIYAVIDRYLSKGSPAFMSDWFVGTASDVEYRLFIEHHVDRGNGTWIYRRAETLSVAAEIAAAYEQAGCDGPSMGRSRWKRIDNEYKAANSDGHAHNDQEAGMYVYAFLKDEYTIPDSGKSFNARSDYSDRG